MNTQQFQKEVAISAPVSLVWQMLTDIGCMKKWMGEGEMNLEIQTNWIPGSPIIISGFHHVKFENNGIITKFQPPYILEYTSLSSLSRLPHLKENYSTILFKLTGAEDQTLLTLTVSNFPTQTIFKHLEFYWTTTLQIIKEVTKNSIDEINKNESTSDH